MVIFLAFVHMRYIITPNTGKNQKRKYRKKQQGIYKNCNFNKRDNYRKHNTYSKLSNQINNRKEKHWHVIKLLRM